MEEVIQYLQMKNKYYEKFFSISTKFLEETNSDRWDNLSFFVENRERLLNIIRSLDQKIARAFKDSSTNEDEMNSYRDTLKNLFDKKKSLGEKIIAIDLQLISKIDAMKTQTIKKLKSTLKTTHHLDSFERSTSSKRRRTKDA
jgi:soluble cytochrome b562